MSSRFEIPDDHLDIDGFNDLLRRTAKELASRHASLSPAGPARPAGDGATPSPAAAWRARWRRAEAQCERAGSATGQMMEHLRQAAWLAEQYLHRRDELFELRQKEGYVREGVNGPSGGDSWTDVPADDVLADVASVAVDVEMLAGPRAAQRLMRWYHEFANEQHPASLAHFFVAYHALDRGDAALARQHLEQARPRLVIIGGGPGTGKSTLAGSVADVAGWPVLAVGEVADKAVLRQAEQLLHHGEAVILDGPWLAESERERAREVAARAGAEIVEIECALSPAIARERLAWQMASIWDPSDETPDIVDAVAARFEPWPEAVRIDTGHPLLRCRSDALKAILGFPAAPPGGSEQAHALMDEDHVDHRGDHVGDRHVLR